MTPDLTIDEVQDILRLPGGRRGVMELCKAGDLPGAYKARGRGGGTWRVPPAAIDAYRGARTTAARGVPDAVAADVATWPPMPQAVKDQAATFFAAAATPERRAS